MDHVTDFYKYRAEPDYRHVYETAAEDLDRAPAWTPPIVDYGFKVAIMMAVELNTGERHPDGADLREAAWHLGAVGLSKIDLLSDLAGMLTMYGQEPTPTVQRALGLQLNNEQEAA